MPVIFRAKTHEGYVCKVLSELLQNNLKTACFQVDSKGIHLRMTDSKRTILIDLDLEADKFTKYKYKNKTEMYLGINLTHFHKMLKSIKKRDSVELFINDNSPTDLGIKVIPKENNRITTSFIKIQTIQNIDTDLPDGYGKSVNIPSGEFQKMCKSLSHISKDTHITSHGFMIRFSSDAGGVMKRYIEFGEPDDSDSDEDEVESKEFEYNEEFDTEKLTRIAKLAGLNTTMQVFPRTNAPLLFRSSVGSIGKISIFVKSKNIMDAEAHAVESDED